VTSGIRTLGRASAALAVASAIWLAPVPGSAAPVPSTTCDVLPADDIWNTDISALPVHDSSDEWLASMHAGSTNLHPDFGDRPYGFPFKVVSPDTPRVRVRFHYGGESDHVRYPLTRRTPIEGGSDRHALMINEESCKLFELFAVRWNDGLPTAGSGAVFELGSSDLRPDGWTSADAAGLPIFPGLVRYDEVEEGAIAHALRVTADVTTDSYVWPARHEAGVSDPNAPPMGARFRLSSDYPLGGLGEKARVILQAMKTYGLIVADNGSDWYVSGTQDHRWRNSLLDQIKSVPADEFEAVDTSVCIVHPDSGQANCAH
jgi:hypothetical protein